MMAMALDYVSGQAWHRKVGKEFTAVARGSGADKKDWGAGKPCFLAIFRELFGW